MIFFYFYIFIYLPLHPDYLFIFTYWFIFICFLLVLFNFVYTIIYSLIINPHLTHNSTFWHFFSFIYWYFPFSLFVFYVLFLWFILKCCIIVYVCLHCVIKDIIKCFCCFLIVSRLFLHQTNVWSMQSRSRPTSGGKSFRFPPRDQCYRHLLPSFSEVSCRIRKVWQDFSLSLFVFSCGKMKSQSSAGVCGSCSAWWDVSSPSHKASDETRRDKLSL